MATPHREEDGRLQDAVHGQHLGVGRRDASLKGSQHIKEEAPQQGVRDFTAKRWRPGLQLAD